MTDKMNIAVIFGGRSVEHDVSIISGFQAYEAMDRSKYNPIPVYIARDNVWYIGEAMTDISFFRREHPPLNDLRAVLPAPDAANAKLRLIELLSGAFRKPLITTLDCIIPVTHGTFGEDGCLQGLLEMGNIPYAGSDV
ncbi:D-alanine--D-alanine ligase, partial [Calditrichota bacterium]